ncbi:hypothetical protein Syun_013920 [Stephania yunnanensis]|uniref:Uncharacterized protein n=1 Tax=Stephania yunnanensis TaxID=152371 RepID=A0AAP0PBA6_9MAGN
MWRLNRDLDVLPSLPYIVVLSYVCRQLRHYLDQYSCMIMDLIQTYIYPHDSSAWNDLDMAMQNPLILHDHHQHGHTNELNFQHPLHQTPSYNLTPSSIQALINSPRTTTFSNIIAIHDHEEYEEQEEELGAMKEMMYKIAAMQPVDIDPTTIRKPRGETCA